MALIPQVKGRDEKFQQRKWDPITYCQWEADIDYKDRNRLRVRLANIYHDNSNENAQVAVLISK
jgi:hypothetical protein